MGQGWIKGAIMAYRGDTEFMGDALPEPAYAGDARDLVWKEFSGQFAEYSKGARDNRRAYQFAKVSAILIGAAVTVRAAVGVIAWVTATLAAGIVVLEGLQQMFQWQRNWIEYRRSAEIMREQGLAFAARTGAYAGNDRRDHLAAVMQDVASTENGAWAGRMNGEHTGADSSKTRELNTTK